MAINQITLWFMHYASASKSVFDETNPHLRRSREARIPGAH